LLPITPPEALISSIAMSATSLRTVSLIAMVPESEWRIPTLTVLAWAAASCVPKPTASAAASASALKSDRRFIAFLPLGGLAARGT